MKCDTPNMDIYRPSTTSHSVVSTVGLSITNDKFQEHIKHQKIPEHLIGKEEKQVSEGQLHGRLQSELTMGRFVSVSSSNLEGRYNEHFNPVTNAY